MAVARYVSVVGLGFGDCGKGRFVDALCAREPVHTVVRFNGGAQAGHTVRPGDGRAHVFAQFGAGSFHPGVHTVLAAPMVVHPAALLVEARVLAQAGVPDVLDRLSIDARCLVTTPWHQAVGRLRECLRGAQAHGTCGVGVGETVAQALADPDTALHYADLADAGLARAKAEALATRLRLQFPLDGPACADARAAAELALLHDRTLATRWMAQIAPCVAQVPGVDAQALATRLAQPGTVVFEGAQGVLLDQWHGFHPHTTWSSVLPQAVDALLGALGLGGPHLRLGVLRCYATRHGAGPLPTHDAALDALLPEPDNGDGGWQGAFRRGHPDAVLMRYALEACQRLDGLLVSHADVFARLPAGLRWCSGHALDTAGSVLERLPMAAGHDLDHQQRLGQWLSSAVPRYADAPVRSWPDWRARLGALTPWPVLWRSDGPGRDAVQVEAALPWS